jgi:hypothetical protein
MLPGLSFPETSKKRQTVDPSKTNATLGNFSLPAKLELHESLLGTPESFHIYCAWSADPCHPCVILAIFVFCVHLVIYLQQQQLGMPEARS